MKKILTLAGMFLLSTMVIEASDAIAADTNGDGKVNKEDVQLIYNYILGTAGKDVTLNEVDVDRNGKVNTADVVHVYRTLQINIGDVNVGDWDDAESLGDYELE